MIKKFLVIILCVLMVLSVSACGKNDTNSTKNSYSLWCAPSTIKIMQEDVDFDNKREAKLVFDAVKNEYESYQLMITATGDISSYSLSVADLKGTEGTFSANNFEIYNEWYVYVSQTSTLATNPGNYPDGLIPQELSEKAGENKVGAGCNQGIWVTVYVPKETKAGLYTGSFTLTVDGETTAIPVSLNVRDYTLSDSTHMRTLFVTQEDRMMESEFDCSEEMKTAYYEFFLKYRTNLNALPMSNNNPQEIVDSAMKYCNDERVNTYQFMGSSEGGCWREIQNWRPWLYAFAENSNPEHDLFKKLVWYYTDEPNGAEGGPEAGSRTCLAEYSAVNGMIMDVYNDILADTTGKYDGLKLIDGWENYFLAPKNVCTIGLDLLPRMYDEVTIWCPDWNIYQDESQGEKWDALVEEYYEIGSLQEYWWYGCMAPRNPYPTYHIDDELMTSRIVSWLAQRNGVEGTLYWGTETLQNVYETPYYRGQPGYELDTYYPTGDGYLVYPGSKYNHFGPLPSMRLMSIRDGFEEYDLLIDIENAYNTFLDSYAIDKSTFNSRQIVSKIYDRIADNGIKTIRNADLFDLIRLSLLNSIDELKFGLLVTDSKIDKNNIATVTFYVNEEYTVKHNGNVLTNGPHYTVQIDLNSNTNLDIEISKGEEKYNVSRYISKPWHTLASFDTTVGVTSSNEGSIIDLTTEHCVSEKAVSVELKSIETEFAAYKLRAVVDSKAFAQSIDLSSIENIKLNVYNENDFEYELRIWLNANGSEKLYLTTILKPGMNELSFNLSNEYWAKLSKVNQIIFEVDNVVKNVDDVVSLVTYNMVIDDIEYTKK